MAFSGSAPWPIKRKAPCILALPVCVGAENSWDREDLLDTFRCGRISSGSGTPGSCPSGGTRRWARHDGPFDDGPGWSLQIPEVLKPNVIVNSHCLHAIMCPDGVNSPECMAR